MVQGAVLPLPCQTARVQIMQAYESSFPELLRFVCAGCLAKQDKPDDEQDGDGCDPGVGSSGELSHDAHQGGAHEGGAFAENVIDTEVFPRFFGRDDPGKVGTGQGLDGALEHSHQESQKPELPLLVQLDSEQRDQRIGSDADLQKQRSGILLGKPGEEQGKGEGDHLGQKESQEKPCRVKPQGASVGSRHLDDGIDPVDEEKECQKVQENMLLPPDIQERPVKPEKAFFYRMLWEGDKMPLAVMFKERKAHKEPPCRIDDEGKGHGGLHGKPQAFVHQYQGQGQEEGNAASNISPGITVRGDAVQSFRSRHIHQHGIIKDQACAVSYLGDDEYHQKGEPGRWKGEDRTCRHAQDHAEGEQRFFEILCVSQRTQGGAKDGDQDCGDAGGISPVGQVIHLRDPGAAGQGVEIDGEDGGNQQDEGGIAHIVENPVFFQFGKLCMFLHNKAAPLLGLDGQMPNMFYYTRFSLDDMLNLEI